MVDLRKDRAHVAEIWNGTQESLVPLRVAAAFTFHQTRRSGEELLTEDEYANALDIAAAALSRLVAIYTPDARGRQMPLEVNNAGQRFRGGATAVQGADGAMLAPLAIARGDLLPALVAIERSGIEYLAPRRLQPEERRQGG